jgi:hypothetical protein
VRNWVTISHFGNGDHRGIEFRDQAPLRGPEQNANKPSAETPRDRLTLSAYLPVGSEPGHYEVQIVQEPGLPLAQAEGSAEFREHIPVLTVRLRRRGDLPRARHDRARADSQYQAYRSRDRGRY